MIGVAVPFAWFAFAHPAIFEAVDSFFIEPEGAAGGVAGFHHFGMKSDENREGRQGQNKPERRKRGIAKYEKSESDGG
jgi:hypothetical protein